MSVASDVRDRRPALHEANVGFDDLLGGFHFSALRRQIARKKNSRAKIMAAKKVQGGQPDMMPFNDNVRSYPNSGHSS
ncbi:MAG TPA: hypothetical protein VF852_10795, partial [Pseudolabrys sp.]